MTWDEVGIASAATSGAPTIKGAVWNTPTSRTKNESGHRVLLSLEAADLFETLRCIKESVFLFFAPRGGMLCETSLFAVMQRILAIKEKANQPGYLGPSSKRPVVTQALHSTIKLWTAEQGYPRDRTEIAQAYFIGAEVARTYQRFDMLQRRREMMSAWAGFLSLDGLEPKSQRSNFA